MADIVERLMFPVNRERGQEDPNDWVLIKTADAAEASQEITRLREEVRVLSYQYKCACETVEDQHYALNKRRAPTSEPL